MIPRDFLADDTIDLLEKIRTTMNQLEQPLRILVDEGFPVREHWARFEERKAWMEKMIRVFNLPT